MSGFTPVNSLTFHIKYAMIGYVVMKTTYNDTSVKKHFYAMEMRTCEGVWREIMSYKIIVDSCGELTKEMKASGKFETASLEIDVNGHHMVDDDTFDQSLFLKYVKESPECPKSSCPSPKRYMEGYCCEADRVYAVTLSAELSGSYNSAVLGKNLYTEEYGEKDIYVFNSRSASIGETLIALKIQECEEQGLSFAETVRRVEEYIEGQNTYFVLETLETLRKNGRLTGLKAVMATALNIKPVMGATPEGTICQLGQARGVKKALVKMGEHVIADVKNSKEKILAISHCNCRERAESVKEMLKSKADFKNIIILDTAGISSMYAADGGIIVVV
jgi:EDD domain protein, DegV family